MTFAARWVRLLMVVSAAGLAGAAYAIRAVGDGPIDQYSGAALSAAIVYTIVLFIRPRISPLPAAGAAVAYCWFIEFAQLTPLARRNLPTQLVRAPIAGRPVRSRRRGLVSRRRHSHGRRALVAS
ncbi:DUF2809 domain-containing protein [Actinomadura verrucosospora]|uniref:DUF2809 domain-containing protein n=1 Tax=Actinomadura verrucosospora TaxID=46165 RepID=UPI0031ECA891